MMSKYARKTFSQVIFPLVVKCGMIDSALLMFVNSGTAVFWDPYLCCSTGRETCFPWCFLDTFGMAEPPIRLIQTILVMDEFNHPPLNFCWLGQARQSPINMFSFLKKWEATSQPNIFGLWNRWKKWEATSHGLTEDVEGFHLLSPKMGISYHLRQGTGHGLPADMSWRCLFKQCFFFSFSSVNYEESWFTPVDYWWVIGSPLFISHVCICTLLYIYIYRHRVS